MLVDKCSDKATTKAECCWESGGDAATPWQDLRCTRWFQKVNFHYINSSPFPLLHGPVWCCFNTHFTGSRSTLFRFFGYFFQVKSHLTQNRAERRAVGSRTHLQPKSYWKTASNYTFHWRWYNNECERIKRDSFYDQTRKRQSSKSTEKAL